MNASPRTSLAPEEPSLPEPRISRSPASPSTAGTKRPATSLLPPFEPLSSSPGLPRPLKRRNTNANAQLKYPTPVPTSSTGILSSSPQRASLARAASERAPLSAVPTLELPESGDVVCMGRSSNSSHFQLSANRLISRVHVRARFIAAASPLEHGKVEIVCTGWNGLKLHSQGRTWELYKGDSFTSETDGSEIMMDVQDARVMIQWPKQRGGGADLSDSSWDDSPRSQARANAASLLQSSPLRRATRIQSPTSPTPANRSMSSSQRLQSLLPETNGIQIYEDEDELPLPRLDPNSSMRTEATASFSSELSDAEEHDPDEENDPIVHSFGPFGANIASRLASISTKSPKAPHKRPLTKPTTLNALQELASDPPSSPPPRLERFSPDIQLEPKAAAASPSRSPSPAPSVEIDPAVTNHVINQLAFSRLSSTPLSTIMANLPAEEKHGLAKESLRAMIEATACVGIIRRQGKDAAGKPLESEYYYVPEHDDDPHRRAAVDGLRKPSLRNCRKQHKQYYWKRPRTP
jgi:hypothetical protein